jgi:hypothetical protein
VRTFPLAFSFISWLNFELLTISRASAFTFGNLANGKIADVRIVPAGLIF